ncbi:MAG: hypothetical protein ACQETE_12475 [Bacteroidota bacterium]
MFRDTDRWNHLGLLILILGTGFISGCGMFDYVKPEEQAKQEAAKLDSLMAKPEWSTEADHSYPLPPQIWDLTHQKIWLEPDFQTQTVTGSTELQLISRRDSNNFVDLQLDSAQVWVRNIHLLNRGTVDSSEYVDQGLRLWVDPIVAQDDTVLIGMDFTAQAGEKLIFTDPTGEDIHSRTQVWGDGAWGGVAHWLPTQYRPDERMKVEYWITAPDSLITVANGVEYESRHIDSTRITHYWGADQVAPYQLHWTVGEFFHWPIRNQGSLYEGYTWGESDPWSTMYEPLISDEHSLPLPTNDHWMIVPIPDWRHRGYGLDQSLWVPAYSQFDERAANEFSNGDLFTELGWNSRFSSLKADTWSDVAFLTGAARYQMMQSNDAEDRQYLIHEWKKHYLNAARQYRRPLITENVSSLNQYQDQHTLYKWPLILRQLETQVTPQLIQSTLSNLKPGEGRSVYERFKSELERRAGRTLNTFFDDYIVQRGHPWIKTRVDTNRARSELWLTLQQIQDQERQPLFALDIPYQLHTSEGSIHGRLTLNQSDSTYVIPYEGTFYDLLLDPDGQLLVDWTSGRLSRSQLTDRLQHISLTVRLRALEYLIDYPDSIDGLVPLLRELSVDDKQHWSVRQQAIRILRKHNQAFPFQQKERWIEPQESEGRVRLEALRWAAQDTTDQGEQVVMSYLGDSSYFVEAEAIKLLGLNYLDEVGAIAGYVDSSSYRSVIKRALIQGVRGRTDTLSIDILSQLAMESTGKQYRLEAMQSLNALAARGWISQRAFERKLKYWLDSPFQTVREQAYRIIGDRNWKKYQQALEQRLQAPIAQSEKAVIRTVLHQWEEKADIPPDEQQPQQQQ